MKKRLITLALMAVMCMSAFAQLQGQWTKADVPGDELTETEAYTAYTYQDKIGAFVCFGWDSPEFRLVTNKGVFEESVYYTGFGESHAVKVLAGIYDLSADKVDLVERFNIFMDVEKSSLGDKITINPGSLKREKKKALKIMNAVTKPKTVVRFICNRYGEGSFDMLVPSYRY